MILYSYFGTASTAQVHLPDDVADQRAPLQHPARHPPAHQFTCRRSRPRRKFLKKNPQTACKCPSEYERKTRPTENELADVHTTLENGHDSARRRLPISCTAVGGRRITPERQRRIDYSKSRWRSGARVPACTIGRRARRRRRRASSRSSGRQQRVVLLSNVDHTAVKETAAWWYGGGAARQPPEHAQQQYNRAHVLRRAVYSGNPSIDRVARPSPHSRAAALPPSSTDQYSH